MKFAIYYFCFGVKQLDNINYNISDMKKDIKNLENEYVWLKDIDSMVSRNTLDDLDTFYYGFPIKIEKVEMMYDKIKKMNLSDLYFRAIDEARVLGKRIAICTLIKDDPETIKLIDDALDALPCAAMNGFTPKEYEEEGRKEYTLVNKFSKVPQNNAHLCKRAADDFYDYIFSLYEYINKKYNIVPSLKKIYKQKNLDVKELTKIDDYLWAHKEEITAFINENPYKFNKKELEEIEMFKDSITFFNFIVVGFEREYTEVYDFEHGKLYMIKGVRTNLDEIIDKDDLPMIISTTLIPYRGYITFNGFFKTAEIDFGNDMKETILKEISNAIKYYHL